MPLIEQSTKAHLQRTLQLVTETESWEGGSALHFPLTKKEKKKRQLQHITPV